MCGVDQILSLPFITSAFLLLFLDSIMKTFFFYFFFCVEDLSNINLVLSGQSRVNRIAQEPNNDSLALMVGLEQITFLDQ